mgnify:CR=1 FL=1
MIKLIKEGAYTYSVCFDNQTNTVPRLYINEEIKRVLGVEQKSDNSSLLQLKNLSSLPGLLEVVSLADIHPGYGAPIGTTTASDLKEGVITFASTGFDINCISKYSKIMHELGYVKNICDFEETLFDEKIKVFDEGLKSAKLLAFQKLKPKRMFKIKTLAGREIKATPDHPFYTRLGKKMLFELKTNDWVLVNPFVGVEYAEPSEKVLVGEFEAKKCCKDKFSEKRAISKLKKIGLLPLTTKNPSVGILLRIIGRLQGTGSITVKKRIKRLLFHGDREDLEKIKSDLNEIGISSSIHSLKKNYQNSKSHNELDFASAKYYLSINSLPAYVILKSLGAIVESERGLSFSFPNWLREQPLWMKRLYLAGFFGAKMSNTMKLISEKRDLTSIVVSQDREWVLTESNNELLKEISTTLKEFEIESNVVNQIVEDANEDAGVSIQSQLVIKSDPQNLVKFYSKIGFEYNEKMRQLANYAIQYLILKKKIISQSTFIEKEAIALNGIQNTTKIIHSRPEKKLFFPSKLSYEKSVCVKEKEKLQIDFNWLDFEEFIEKEECFSGFVWDKIEKVEEIPVEEFVYDFTVSNEKHNFIANGFVVGNCGVHGLVVPLSASEVRKKKKELAEQLFKDIPAGLGMRGKLVLTKNEMDEVLEKGAGFIVEKGYGSKKDLRFIEEKGKIKNVDTNTVSDKAKERALDQIGTLGSGNHYCEVQEIEKIYDEKAAKVFGLKERSTFVSIHCGSRALGHQIGTDYLQILDSAVKKYGIKIPARDLACAPIESEEGRNYLSAINAGSNAAFANRFLIGSLVKKSFLNVFGINEEEIKTFYDVGHNTAKIETHYVGQFSFCGDKKNFNPKRKKRKVLVQRKGSTRGFGPGNIELPTKYRMVGQPILVGGSMGTNSFILKGTKKAMQETLGSTIHGAGRRMSRIAALRKWDGRKILESLATRGILIKARSLKGLPEEAPDAYKDINMVVDIMHKVGVSEKVAKLTPVICIKG